MLNVEPIAESLPTPLAGTVCPDRCRGALLSEGIYPSNLVGNPCRRIAQDKARDALGVCRGEQQPDDPTRGFADPMHPRQRHRLEHREDLGFDLLWCKAVARRRSIGGAAAEQIGAID